MTTTIKWLLKSRGVNALVEAPLAMASQLLDGGRTAQSTFKILFPVHSESTRNIDVSSQIADDLRKTSLTIWDEIVMSLYHSLEAIDCTLCAILLSTLPFNEIGSLRNGDFRQILPILGAANSLQIVAACINK